MLLRAILDESIRKPLPDYWQNDVGPQFLESMAAWIEDSRGGFGAGEVSDEACKWFANVLLAGVQYE